MYSSYTFFMLHLYFVFQHTASCTNGLIRLVDGTDKFEGRLEYCVDGKWGTVCDDGFGDIDAQKACKQMGLPFQSKLKTTCTVNETTVHATLSHAYLRTCVHVYMHLQKTFRNMCILL